MEATLSTHKFSAGDTITLHHPAQSIVHPYIVKPPCKATVIRFEREQDGREIYSVLVAAIDVRVADYVRADVRERMTGPRTAAVWFCVNDLQMTIDADTSCSQGSLPKTR